MLANRVLVVVAVCYLTFASPPVRGGSKQPAEKMSTVHFEKAKWVDVFDWYARVTELKADVRAKPDGTLTLTPRMERHFTRAEITDLLNEALMVEGIILIPCQKTFSVVSADKIDPKLIPLIELKDLARSPRTALVEVVIPFESDLPAEEVGVELKKLVTPFGDVVSVKDKSIRVRDTAANIQRIRMTIAPL